MKMTRDEYCAKKATISKRARAVLERMERGSFYRVEQVANTASVTELLDAGLVQRAGWVESVVSCYVPACGFTRALMDQIDVETPEPGPVAAPDLLESLRECKAGLASLLRSEGYSDHLFRVTSDGPYKSACEVLARSDAAIAKAEGRG